MKSRTALYAGIIVIALAALAGAQAPRSVWGGIYTEDQALRGEPLYAESCAECHGSELEGGEMGPALAGSDFMWNWNGLSVGDIFERLRVSMPEANPRSMTNQEKADVLAYMLLRNEIPAGGKELPSRTQTLMPVQFEALAP